MGEKRLGSIDPFKAVNVLGARIKPGLHAGELARVPDLFHHP
jgi:hypothetical protein